MPQTTALVSKRLDNKDILCEWSNLFWKTKHIVDAQLTQLTQLLEIMIWPIYR